MTYTYKCENTKCEDFDKSLERNVPISENNSQKCEHCDELLKRVYMAPASIRTSDGYKR
jgi:predicted nucleic acid-binding Zn ribbon protein